MSNIITYDILVTSTINSFGTQRRFNDNITVGELKQKLELVTGASPATMELELLSDKKETICKLTDNDAKLSFYKNDFEKAAELFVKDSSKQVGEFDDVSKVKKFELSEEQYSKRADSVREFKKKFQSGDPNPQSSEEKLREEQEAASKISVGNRCQVQIAGKPSRRGTVMYVGKTDFKPGYWVGVKYDEPMGKNDGSVNGKRYFECLPKYGGFVKPYDVTVGDFPEEPMDLDEI